MTLQNGNSQAANRANLNSIAAAVVAQSLSSSANPNNRLANNLSHTIQAPPHHHSFPFDPSPNWTNFHHNHPIRSTSPTLLTNMNILSSGGVDLMSANWPPNEFMPQNNPIHLLANNHRNHMVKAVSMPSFPPPPTPAHYMNNKQLAAALFPPHQAPASNHPIQPPPTYNQSSKLKLKTEKVFETGQLPHHHHHHSHHQNIPMINVENVNFYSSPPAMSEDFFANHHFHHKPPPTFTYQETSHQQSNKNCHGCLVNPSGSTNPQTNTILPPPPLTSSTSKPMNSPPNKINCDPSSAAAAAAAAVVMNLHKLFSQTNSTSSSNMAQPNKNNNNNNNNNKMESVKQITSEYLIALANNASNKKDPSVFDNKKPNESLRRKSLNQDSSIKKQSTNNNKNNINNLENNKITEEDKKSVVSLSSSSSVKSIQTLSSQKNNKNIKIEQVKEEPIQTELNNIQDDRDDRSSMSGSVNLIVDETSISVEPNTTKVEETQIVIQNDESSSQKPSLITEPPTVLTLTTTINTTDNKEICTVEEKTNDSSTIPSSKLINLNQNWILHGEQTNNLNKEFDENVNIDGKYSNTSRYESIKNTIDGMVLNINDFIMFENRRDSETENSTAPKSTKIADSTSNELINESSNTNYSIDDEEGDNDFKTCVAKIVSLWKDNSTDKLMIAIRYFYRPEQLKNEQIMNKTDVKFEDCKELVSTNQYDVIELTSIKSKCFIMDLNRYKERQQDDKNEQDFFYRYEYDFNEKKLNLLN